LVRNSEKTTVTAIQRSEPGHANASLSEMPPPTETDFAVCLTGTPVPPQGRYSADEWEDFIREWVTGLNTEYVQIDREPIYPRPGSRPRTGWRTPTSRRGTRFATKPQLAWRMIERAADDPLLTFGWVTGDEAYGDTPSSVTGATAAG
jgi:hypothetical protein